MPEIHYLSVADVIALHYAIMERFGRTDASLRDEGLLESAVMRSRMASYYEQADLIRQCALLAVSISQAQAFTDGNKRAAFAACDVFLRINGFIYMGNPLSLAQQLEQIATRITSLEEAVRQFEQWLRTHVQLRTPSEP